ncbi:MAG: condensation domain-containing protein, partial [Acidobacteriota bacterium]|nr:condensation domain-containing protein [Acidobacteriota bacterium]
MSRPSAPDLAERLAALSPEKRELLERRLKERALESGRAEAILTEPGRRQAPLSFSQQRIWFLDRLERDGSAYNVPTAVRVRGTLDVSALARAIQAIVDRHASLRTRFPEVEGMPVQRIEEHASIAFPVVDLGGLPADERAREARRMVRDEAVRPFDLARGPVLRAGLIRLAADEHVFLCTLHHIVSDGWSRTVFFRELSALYGAYASGSEPALPPLPIQYADYTAWQQEWLRSGRMEPDLDYWRNQLRDLPVLDLPTDHPRPVVQTIRGGRCDVEIPARVAQGLKAFCRVEGVTLFMAMLSALGLLLRRYSGQNDQVIGSLTANRDRIETEGLIGIFINALAMRIDLSGDPTFRDLVRRVREVALGAYAHKEVPFEKLVQALQPQRDPGRSPIYQTMVNIDTAAPRTVRLPGLIVEDLDVPDDVALLDLTLVVRDRGHELFGSFEYNADLFEPETIRRMSGHLGVLLAAVVANPDERVSSVPILTEAERRRIVIDWNDTARDYPADQRLHELFEARVETSPRAVALREGSRQIEYGALNRDANRLARYLRSNGVGPGSIVGVCLERSAWTVTALLAIFKAGAAYVPLDPAYPEERIAFMLKDSGAKTVLTERRSANRVANVLVKEIRLDEIASDLAAEEDGNLGTPGTSEDLAYVIYTSGSTGTPKGVEAVHRASVNRFAWMWQAYPFAEGEVCCQKTTLSFVDSIWEIFGPLLQGVPSVVLSPDAARDPRVLVDRLSVEGVSRIVLVPSLLRALLDSGIDLAGKLPRLKWWVTSGETLPLELQRRFRATMPEAVLMNL